MDECKQCFVIIIVIIVNIIIIIISGTHGLTLWSCNVHTTQQTFTTHNHAASTQLPTQLPHNTHETHETHETHSCLCVCLFVWCCADNKLGPEGAKHLAPTLTMMTNMTNL